jgi:hypothetical protein
MTRPVFNSAWIALAVAAGVQAPLAHAAETPTAADLLKKVVQNVYARSEQSTYVMKLIDAEGHESLRKMQVFFRKDDDQAAKLLVKFAEPADIRGTALLSVAEKGKPLDQWIYLPKLKKTRRIRGGNESESFLGSDFTVGDITASDADQERYVYQVTDANKKCGEQACYELTGTPKSGVDPASLPYSKRVLNIRKADYVSTHVDFYDASGALQKTLELKNIHQDQGKYWTANAMEMTDARTRHRTVIEVQKRDSNKAPSNSVFTQSYLERD